MPLIPTCLLGLHMLAHLCDLPSGSICLYTKAEPLSHLENNPVVCDFLTVTVLLRPPVTCTHEHTYRHHSGAADSENSWETAMGHLSGFLMGSLPSLVKWFRKHFWKWNFTICLTLIKYNKDEVARTWRLPLTLFRGKAPPVSGVWKRIFSLGSWELSNKPRSLVLSL